MSEKSQNIWLIGSGAMSVAYVDVLKAMDATLTVIGRGEVSAQSFFEETDIKPITGGLSSFLDTKPEFPDAAIVAVGVEQLASVTEALIKYGVKKILVEKPGALDYSQLEKLHQEAERLGSSVYIAYNRRFYASVQKAIGMIEIDGGVTSFLFEFTEWSHKIEPLTKGEGVKKKWFLANSTHVTDLAFFIGGFPDIIDTHISGSLSWHPSGSVFSGSGKTEKNALFSYHADWTAAGRWGCEFLTKKNRYILKPLEELKVQKTGSITIENVEIDDSLDKKYKPGLYQQVEDFFMTTPTTLPTLKAQLDMTKIYYKIANYK